MITPKSYHQEHSKSVACILRHVKQHQTADLDLELTDDKSPAKVCAYNPAHDAVAAEFGHVALTRIGRYEADVDNFVNRFLNAKRYADDQKKLLDILGAFPKSHSLSAETRVRGNLSQRLAGLFDGIFQKKSNSSNAPIRPRFDPGFALYRPGCAKIYSLHRRERDLREIGLIDTSPKHGVLADLFHRFVAPSARPHSELVLATGIRNIFGTDSKHGTTRVVSQQYCRMITAVDDNRPNSEMASIKDLLPPDILVDRDHSYVTHPCVGVYSIFEHRHTETRFVYLHRETGGILALGILTSSQINPFIHPGEFVSAVNQLAHLRCCA